MDEKQRRNVARRDHRVGKDASGVVRSVRALLSRVSVPEVTGGTTRDGAEDLMNNSAGRDTNNR